MALATPGLLAITALAWSSQSPTANVREHHHPARKTAQDNRPELSLMPRSHLICLTEAPDKASTAEKGRTVHTPIAKEMLATTANLWLDSEA